MEFYMDMNKSGAVLAKKYFKNKSRNWKELRFITNDKFCVLDKIYNELYTTFDYIQDNDLWLHKLPHSKEFSLGLGCLGLGLGLGLANCTWAF